DPRATPGHKLRWRQHAKNTVLTRSTFLFHAGGFLAAALIGIARYSHDAPTVWTIGLAGWSIVLLLHGLVTYRTTDRSENNTSKERDGVLRTVLLASALNAVMWSMWTLATDGRDSSPWHLTILITL